MDGKYSKYHGDLPNVFGGLGFADGPKTDEEIEALLAAGKEEEAKKEQVKKDSYGYNFSNISHLEEPIGFYFGWWPYVSYEGKDPNNEKLTIKQIVTREYVEENLHELTPDYIIYYGTTIWYDEFGYEVKKEIKRVNDDITKLVEDKHPTVYTRENGIIKKNGEDICFDTGVRELPEYDEKIGDLAYTIIEDFEKISDYKGQIQERKRQFKDKVIKIDTDLSDEEVLSVFKQYTGFMKRLGNSKLNEYIDKKYAELQKALIVEKAILPYKEQIKALESENKKLTSQNGYLKKDLKQALEFIKKIKSNLIGKVFFGKKITEKEFEKFETTDRGYKL